MRAKEYVELLVKCENKEEIPSKIVEILKMFILEISELAKVRKAESIPAIKSIATELNKKWVSFVSLVKKNNIDTYGVDVTNEMFYTALIIVVPELKDVLSEELKKILTYKKSTINQNVGTMEPYKVTPFSEIIKENINSEILCCVTALSNYHMAGLPIDYLKPLVHRISFLRYWGRNGINYDEIKMFEADNEEFLKDKLHFID